MGGTWDVAPAGEGANIWATTCAEPAEASENRHPRTDEVNELRKGIQRKSFGYETIHPSERWNDRSPAGPPARQRTPRNFRYSSSYTGIIPKGRLAKPRGREAKASARALNAIAAGDPPAAPSAVTMGCPLSPP